VKGGELGMEDNTTNQSNKQLPVIVAAVVAIVALVGVGAMVLSKQNTAPAPTADKSTSMDSGLDTGTQLAQSPEALSGTPDTVLPANTSGVTIVAVEAGNFSYKPNEIRVKKGATVKIEMKSVDMMHDFNIDELNVKMPITKSGETGTVEFTADKVGEFEIYCSVGQHRQNGQVGKLIVE